MFSLRQIWLCGTWCLALLLTWNVGLPSVEAFFGELEHIDQQLKNVQNVELDQTQTFRDVPESAWFFKSVSFVARLGIVSGYRDSQGRSLGIFGPQNPVTIAEILKMALMAAQIPEESCPQTPQMGIARNHWASRFVACAEERQFRLLRTSFSLDRPATRAEVLTVIHDAFNDDIPSLMALFRDTQGHRYEADIAYGAASGIVSGDTDTEGNPTGFFRPDDPINRAEAAKILVGKLLFEEVQSQDAQSSTPPPQQDVDSDPEPPVSSRALRLRSGQAPPGDQTIIIRSGNFFYEPSTLTVQKGQMVTLQFENTGSHTFVVDELGIDEEVFGASSTITFTANTTGTFPFYCRLPGHRDAGMEGTLHVIDN